MFQRGYYIGHEYAYTICLRRIASTALSYYWSNNWILNLAWISQFHWLQLKRHLLFIHLCRCKYMICCVDISTTVLTYSGVKQSIDICNLTRKMDYMFIYMYHTQYYVLLTFSESDRKQCHMIILATWFTVLICNHK